MKEVEVCLNGKDWIPVNKNCVDYYYEDSFPILLIVVDELAELTQKGGLKTAQGKEEDAMKDEIIGIIQSITQLGRSAGVLMILATQKPNANIVPTVIRSNPLSLDTIITTNSGDKKLRDITTDDKILGTDNKYHKVLDITPVTIPSRMFEIEFSNGKVKCSFNHQWAYWINDLDFTVDTLALFEDLLYYKENDCYFGKKEDKITILNIKEIEPEEVVCITTDTEDGLFQISTAE